MKHVFRTISKAATVGTILFVVFAGVTARAQQYREQQQPGGLTRTAFQINASSKDPNGRNCQTPIFRLGKTRRIRLPCCGIIGLRVDPRVAAALKLTRICLDPRKCPNHGFGGGHSSGQEATSAEKAKRKKEGFERKVQNVFRKRLAIAVREKLPSKVGDGEISALATFGLKNLGYARRKAVAACYGFGSDLNSAESEKALEKHFAGLKAGDLVKFALICTMVDDLEIASYQKVKDLDKQHPLVVAARSYKVDMAKLYDSTKLELTPKSQRSKQMADSGKLDQKKAKTSNQRKPEKERKQS